MVLPEIAYHYTSPRLKKKILEKGLIATNNYCRDMEPVVWFWRERKEYWCGVLEVRVKVDPKDTCWQEDW